MNHQVEFVAMLYSPSQVIFDCITEVMFAVLSFNTNAASAFTLVDDFVNVEVLLGRQNSLNRITFGVDKDGARKPPSILPLIKKNVRVGTRLQHRFHAIRINPVLDPI